MDVIVGKILQQKARDSIANQMAALEIYETQMGIQRGDGSEVPIALATMKDSREFVRDSDWGRTLRVLLKFKLHQSTGLNIMQLLDLPRWLLKELLDAAKDVARSEPSIMKEIQKDAEQAGRDRAKNTLKGNK